jgi:phospholipid-binding lipoprotein MlaA
MVGDPWAYKDPANVRNMGTAVRLVDLRASVLDASSLIEDAALDRYEFIRDAYLQRRQSRVYDGDVPKGKGRKSTVDDSYLNERSAASPEEEVVMLPAINPLQADVAAEVPSAQLVVKAK